MNKRECETCIKRKTIYCPNSNKCLETENMPYYQNRIMLLEENKKYKEVIEKVIDYINGAYEMATYTKTVGLEEENIEDLLDILKGVEHE